MRGSPPGLGGSIMGEGMGIGCGIGEGELRGDDSGGGTAMGPSRSKCSGTGLGFILM